MAGLIDSLIPLLQRDATALQSLEQALNDERSALEARDNQLLQQAVDLKASLVEQVELNARNKAQLFAQHGLKLSPTHIKAALAKIGRQDVIALWDEVIERLESCKSLNEINGRVVYRSQHSLNRMMNILRGQESQQQLYGENGRGNAIGGRHLLANA